MAGLRLESLEDAEPDAGADADALPDADAGALVLAVVVGVDVAVAVAHGVPVAAGAFLVLVALTLADGETVVAGALAEAVPVVVAVAGAVVSVPVGLLVVPAGVPLSPLLVLPLAGLVSELAGDAVGVSGLVGLAEADGEELGGHAGAVALLWPMEVAPWLRVPLDAPLWVAVPARLGGPLVLCEEVIPTAVLRL